MFIRISRLSVSAANLSSASLGVYWASLLLVAATSVNWLADVQAQNISAGQIQTDGQIIQALEVGKTIERELPVGESHTYPINLNIGQYLSAIVEQRGIDVVVQLLGPDSKLLFEFDTAIRSQGQEIVTLVGEITGRYKLIVQPKQKATATGRYEIRLVELRAATEGDRALQNARKLNVESIKLWRTDKYEEALPIAERVLEIREQVLGTEHLDVAQSLHNLAAFYSSKGDEAKAIQMSQRALAIREKILEADDSRVADSLFNLALLIGNIYGEVESLKAESLHQRALAIREKTLGIEHPDVANSLSSLATLYWDRGDFVKAEPAFQRSLTIREKTLGLEHLDVATSLNTLAGFYLERGDYARAEPTFQRSLLIREKVLGVEHPYVADTLNNLALLYTNKGDYVQAEPLYQRALAIRKKNPGPKQYGLTVAFQNLADLYSSQGDYEKAEPLLQRTLVIREDMLGADHPEVARVLNDLANLYWKQDDSVKAEPLYERALSIREKKLGTEHPYVATSLNNLASIYAKKRDFVRAEPMYQRALNVLVSTVGAEHPDVVEVLNNLATLYRDKGDYANAIKFQSRACVVAERNIALNTTAGSERQKLAYLATLSKQSDNVISLHSRSLPNDYTACNLAFTTILQRKGRALDAMTDSIATLRRRASAQDQALLDLLKDVHSQLARLVLSGPQRTDQNEHQAQIDQLRGKAEKLEGEVASRSAEFLAQSQQVTLSVVQKAIPVDTALVEFFVYRPFNQRALKHADNYGAPHYIAYVLRQQGEIQWAELGEAKVIDAAVGNLRQALRDANRRDIKQLARLVNRIVMQPLLPLLGNAHRILLSPDGALNLVPFAALVDSRGEYLVNRYSFTYLTSGRDLLRLQVKQESGKGAVVLANPEFGEKAEAKLAIVRDIKAVHNEASNTTQLGGIALSLAEAFFSPLPGTAGEAVALKSFLPDAQTLIKAQATETALKQVRHPRILHIATHGFFLNAANEQAGDKVRNLQKIAASSGKIENPYLRSGLALAGANLHRAGTDDGILTALEATGLDLWGTKLVVLSACDTGVGDIRNGDGVYGLRRSLVLAGSETQVMSLWKVSDQGTKELMIDYYKRLLGGEERGDALRQVQLQMLKNPARRHPFYWASFIQSGEWANLEGKR